MLLDEIMHSGRYGTKDSQVTVFDLSYTRIIAEASKNPKAETLAERAERQSAMLRDWNFPHTVVKGTRHQKRRIVGKEGGTGTARAREGSHPLCLHVGVGRNISKSLAGGTAKTFQLCQLRNIEDD